jgi:hypothetical protein
MNASICSCKSSTEVNDAPFSDHVPGHQGAARRRRRHSAGGVIVVRVNGLHELRQSRAPVYPRSLRPRLVAASGRDGIGKRPLATERAGCSCRGVRWVSNMRSIDLQSCRDRASRRLDRPSLSVTNATISAEISWSRAGKNSRCACAFRCRRRYDAHFISGD